MTPNQEEKKMDKQIKISDCIMQKLFPTEIPLKFMTKVKQFKNTGQTTIVNKLQQQILQNIRIYL